MPRGEPTQVVRLPRWFVEHLTPEADTQGCTVPELIVKRLAPRTVAPTPYSANRRCQCKVPTLSKVVSNLCTTCHLVR